MDSPPAAGTAERHAGARNGTMWTMARRRSASCMRVKRDGKLGKDARDANTLVALR